MRGMGRLPLALAVLMVAAAPSVAQADKLPIDDGLRVTITPGISKMKVGQTVDFTMKFTDDDAYTAEGYLSVQGGNGVGMAADGACSSPLDRRPNSGGAVVRAKFMKSGKYVISSAVSTSACHGTITRSGSERVMVRRTITVVR